MLYDHLPTTAPSSWVPASYVSATHYLAHHLFNEPSEFQDCFRYYLALKDKNTSLVKACSNPPSTIISTKKEERDALMHRRAIFMGASADATGWDARIRSWIGIAEQSKDASDVIFNQKVQPIKRESMEDLLWKLGIQSYELSREGWVARKPYHRAERNWRAGVTEIPTELPNDYARDHLLKPLQKKIPGLTEAELAACLFLLKSNPPYSLSRGHDLEQLSEDQRNRIRREDHLQKTRVITQYLADLETRAIAHLKDLLAESLGDDEFRE